MTDLLEPMPKGGKPVVTSKTVIVNGLAAVGYLLGQVWPPLGDFISQNAGPLGAILCGLNVGLRCGAKEPVTLSVTKKF